MSFDPEQFGKAMGEAIRNAVEPLKAEIADLRKRLEDERSNRVDVKQVVADELAKLPPAKDGKDADEGLIEERVTESIKSELAEWKSQVESDIELPDIESMVGAAVAKAMDEIPAPKDGESVTVDDIRPLIEATVDSAVKQIPRPKDGVGMAGSMIDRDGNLIITMTSGETKNLGPVVGRDGLSLESFEMTYDADTHEVVLRATSVGKSQEIRYPAGGIRGKGYWRDGTKASPGDAWTHDGSLWIATKATSETPSSRSATWVLAARKGRDGESVVRRVKEGPRPPIRLQGSNDASES